jgi:protein AbiQ
MASLKFYEVNADYIEYLSKFDRRVPRIDYSSVSTHDKFLCGIVLKVSEHNYFAPISSFTTPQRTNIIIKNTKGRALSSIRFSFMIPIPKGAVTLKDISGEQSKSYKFLLNTELQFCNRNAEHIRQRAKSIYDTVLSGRNLVMIKNCCNFKVLEAACAEYEKEYLSFS